MTRPESTSGARLGSESDEARPALARPLTGLASSGGPDAGPWRRLVEALDGHVFEHDVEADRLELVGARASGAPEGLLGFAAEEWRAPGFWSARLHPEDRAAAAAALLGALAERRDHRLHYRMLARDGSVAWLADSAAVIGDGGRVRRFGVLVDVSESKRIEAALRQSETRQRALLEALPDLMFLLDSEGRFVDVHAQDPDAVPASPGALLGRRFDEALPAGLAVRLRPLFERVLATGEAQSCECTLEIGGRERRFEARMVACGADRVLAIARDIDEQHRLKGELAHALRMESVGRLAGGVAHDFNNLLTGILGFAELGEQLSPAGSALAGYCNRIRIAAERAAELTDQLLAFARKQTVEPRVLAPAAAIAELHGLAQRVIGENVALATELAPDTGCVRIDPTQLQHVLLELLANARDALPEGGRVVVSTENVRRAPRRTGSDGDREEREWVRIAVTDPGVGMAPETLARALEPFFTTKPTGGGTGMGLATCYGIVSQNGGHVELASRLGEGTRVEVLLPRVEPPGGAPAAEASDLPRGSERVLLIEDETVVRELVVGALRSLGYAVRAAADGAEARAIWREPNAAFDVLITDLILASESGASLANALRAERPGLRIVYVSGYSASSVAPQRLVGRGTAFLAKPFSAGELARRLRALLDGPR